MLRFDYLLFGYRKFIFSENELKKAANLFLKNNLAIKFHQNSVYIAEKDYQRVRKILDGNVLYTSSAPLGLYGFLFRRCFRLGIIFAVIISMALVFISGNLVWDIRIEGSLLGNEELIIEELESVGFKIGNSWLSVDKSCVEADMLAKSEYVSWVNINRRGTVAYVSVVDKLVHEDEEKKHGYANVIASRDCIVEEISVKSGVAMVKAGETVKKGQILISGVMPIEAGGGLCYAEGVVIGRYSDSVSVSISNKSVEKIIKAKKINELSVNFFGFPIKLFKIYRNLPEDYAIIKDNRSLSFFDKVKLPIEIERCYVLEYEEKNLIYSEDEMVTIASSEMREALNAELKNANLLKIKTEGSFTNGNYVMYSYYVCSSDVGDTVEFDVKQ